jgi:hypothetical protein
MSNEITNLRKELVQQITDIGNAISKLNEQVAQEKLKLEQLKGAVFALDVLAQRLVTQSAAEPVKQ